MEESYIISAISILKASKDDQRVADFVNNSGMLVPRFHTVAFAFDLVPGEGFQVERKEGRVDLIIAIRVAACVHSLRIIIAAEQKHRLLVHIGCVVGHGTRVLVRPALLGNLPPRA